MQRHSRRRTGGLLAVVLVALAGTVLISGCGSSSSSGSSANEKEVSLAYGSTYVFTKENLAPEYYGQIKKEFEAAHPGVTVKLVPIPGSPTDIETKLGLLYRNPSTAPDVAEMETPMCAKFAGAGYLVDQAEKLPSTNWWGGYPQIVKNECATGSKIYGVNQGENVQAFAYNKEDFRRAGLPVPWRPKNWTEVLAAAKTIKEKVPNVYPMWAMGGTGVGTGILLGVSNLLATSSEPNVYNPSSRKWIVDSKGLRETFEFIHQLTIHQLNSPTADLFNSNATGNAPGLMKTLPVAISLASNYFGVFWIANKEWPQAQTNVEFVPIPTSLGQEPKLGTLILGWDYGISASSNKKVAFELEDFLQQKKNNIKAANAAAWVPPNTEFAQDPEFVNFAPPFQAQFAKLVPHASQLPPLEKQPVWLRGFEQATGELIQDPSATPESAAKKMTEYLTQQLGEANVETKQ